MASKRVGLSHAFHADVKTKHLFHLIKENSNHDHYNYMSSKQKGWWIANMLNVTIQMLETSGDLILICNNGRTRSPMYLVAYLVVVYSMSASRSVKMVSDLLMQQRNEIVDRNGELIGIIERICEILH